MEYVKNVKRKARILQLKQLPFLLCYLLLKKRFLYEIEILVKKIRLEKNMTLETLANLSGVSKGHLSKIERQELDPKITTMLEIALALKVDIKDLYKVTK